jgi:glutamate-5-semialdehyde dehydrogenase
VNAEFQASLNGARIAARRLITADRNAALAAMQSAVSASTQAILQANALDVAAATHAGMSAALLDRLALTAAQLAHMVASVAQVQALADPLGCELAHWQHPLGMQIRKVSVPFGVIGVIYESRPNVTLDAATLCIKAGSAVLLRGSASAQHTNHALISPLRSGLHAAGFDANFVTQIDASQRDSVTAMLTARGKIDLLIPRGGAALIAHVVEHARVPVIETGTGVCHLYVHESADQAAALAILLNGKVQRPGVCNALETLLVDAAIAAQFLPTAALALQAAGVELRGCAQTLAQLPACTLASDADYAAEFLDLVLAIRVVPDMDAALSHIARFSTQHSEAICASDKHALALFRQHVDAAAVYCNASTRFTDGFEFGFGAEIGISTQKLHARGPMGLNEIVTYKYLVDGVGQVR